MLEPYLRSPIVRLALSHAREDFKDELRVIPTARGCVEKPFFLHLQEMAVTLARARCSAEIVTAALLSSHLDAFRNWNEAKIERDFSSSIASLVLWVSGNRPHSPPSHKLEFYLSKIRYAPASALAIIAAAALSHARSLTHFGVHPGGDPQRCKNLGWYPMGDTLAETTAHLNTYYFITKHAAPGKLSEHLRKRITMLESAQTALAEWDMDRQAND